MVITVRVCDGIKRKGRGGKFIIFPLFGLAGPRPLSAIKKKERRVVVVIWWLVVEVVVLEVASHVSYIVSIALPWS